jgi:hypothetical protein
MNIGRDNGRTQLLQMMWNKELVEEYETAEYCVKTSLERIRTAGIILRLLKIWEKISQIKIISQKIERKEQTSDNRQCSLKEERE